MIQVDYTYKAVAVRIVDGDTVDLDLDLGFHTTLRQRVRLARIDTPELNSTDLEARSKAVEAKGVLSALIIAEPLTVTTRKTDKYGRYIAEIYLMHKDIQINASDLLLASGLAAPYLGG